jgi:hypothetical protein
MFSFSGNKISGLFAASSSGIGLHQVGTINH